MVTEPPVTEPEIVTDELRAQWDALAEKCQFQGVLYLTHNGKEGVCYTYKDSENCIEFVAVDENIGHAALHGDANLLDV